MEIGAAIFFTDYSMAPTDLAVALEPRGFDSLWVAEHSHMPVTRRFTHSLGEAALQLEKPRRLVRTRDGGLLKIPPSAPEGAPSPSYRVRDRPRSP